MFKLSNGDIPPAALQLLGYGIMAIMLVVWVVSNRFNPALFAAGGTLLGLGEYARATQKLSQLQEQLERERDAKDHRALTGHRKGSK